MKKLTLTSSEENIFAFNSKRIIDTELTLVVSDPTYDAEIELDFGDTLEIESSVIKAVTKDGSHYDSTIYFYGKGEVTIKNSKIEGSLGFTS